MNMKLKKILCNALCLTLCVGAMAGCGTSKGPKATPEPTKQPEVLDGYETCAIVEIPTTANSQTLDGLGVEWDPHLWRKSISPNKRVATDENWEIIKTRAEYLGIDKVRVWCMGSWYERKNDNEDPNIIDWDSKYIDFESYDFQALIKELDVCEELGIEVTLTLWGCETNTWNACKNTGDWVTAPADQEEYAESVSILLQYLINKCGYTCITGFTPMNEPNLAWKVDGGAIDQDHYIETCKIVDQRLKDDGIRDKIKLVLSDDSTSNNSWFTKCTQELAGVADTFCYHTYLFNENTTPTELYNFAVDRFNIKEANAQSANVTINEFGSNYNVGAYVQTDIDEYVRGIYYSTYAEQALSAGVTGMLHWCFYDVYYNSNDRMMTGLMEAADTGFKCRPFYYTWGLIMKYTEKGSSIYKPNIVERDSDGNVVAYSENLSAVALQSTEGKWTYLLTNRSTTDTIKVQVVNQNGDTPNLKAYIYSEETVNACMNSADDSILPSADESAITIIGTSTFIELKPNTFVLISDME